MLFAGCASDEPEDVPELAAAPTHVGADACQSCHADEHARWLGSHHDLAMQEANSASVLGDFSNTSFRYAGIESRFYQRDDGFFVTTDGPSGELEEFRIAYTFGVDPLQQYLIEFPDGRLQALSIVWDSRPADDGGQRWYHLYPDEAIDHQDPLHWTGPAQNWNFMCAECHSTNVEKNYDQGADRFATSFSEIDVACEACHGPGSAHVAWAQSDPNERDLAAIDILDFPQDGAFTIDADTGIAGPRPDRQTAVQIETCGRCHARRALLSEDYVHGAPLVNTHRPSLLIEGQYFADGQIQDEVFVYGSYLQSKMHGAGVACTDCHDAHSLTVGAPGNGVCAQCHLPTVFDTSEHHLHGEGSPGAECVSCHMPSRTYMVIDDRRDHSFRVPRPDVSARIGSPNACNQCHQDQTAEWAAEVLAARFGERTDEHYGEVIDAGRKGLPAAATKLGALADDETMPSIVRATALALLGQNSGSVDAGAMIRAASSDRALVRIAAADTAAALGRDTQVQLLAPLLRDPALAVRLAAAVSLMNSPRASLRQAQAEDLSAALAEYRATQLLHADRADAHVNLGLVERAEGDVAASAASYRRALERDPGYAPAYVNLADLYREANREPEAETVLRRGLAALPNDASLHHALGLSLVRRGSTEDGESSLRSAHELAPNISRYAYVYAIALNSRGDFDQALDVLRLAHERRPNDGAVLAALATISRDQEQLSDARGYAEKLLELAPNDPEVRRLAESLGAI